MPGSRNLSNLNRRLLLHGLGVSAASLAATRAFAQSDDPLQQLIQQNQREGLGESFDSTSRTIAMPKASLPTLAPANVPTTEAAIERYERIAAAGGGPQGPPAEPLRTGARNPPVRAQTHSRRGPAGRRCRKPSGCALGRAIRRCSRCASG